MRKIISLLFILITSIYAFPQETQLPSQGGPQEEPIPEEVQQEKWSRMFQEAETIFNSAEQASSIPKFQQLITEITQEKVKRGLRDPELILLLRSLDYLGQAFYNDGQEEQARVVFLKLLELNPNYRLNEDLVSSKIIQFVSRIKEENLGVLSIVSIPTGATVKLDGAIIGTTDLQSVYSLKGDHDIEVSRPGFITQKQTIHVVPKKQHKLTFTLERSSSVAYFVTYPDGVEILMGGKRLGVTGGEAPERVQTKAIELNLPLQDFSGEFPIPDLQPGVYELEFRKPCWETSYRRITIEKNDDYYYEPIVLNPSPAYLNITADDDKANIFLDGEYLGIVPKQRLQVCSGKHVLKLKGPRGKFEKQIELKKDQVLTIAAKLNPSLTFVGFVSESQVLPADLSRLKSEIDKQLSTLQNLNYVDYTTMAPDPAVLTDLLKTILDGLRTNRPDQTRHAKIQDLCTKVESDLILIGYVPTERLQRTVHFYLLSYWSSMADIRTIQVFDQEQWNRFRTELEYEEPLFQKRLGVRMVDTLITPGPVIGQVIVKTFDDSQPLRQGDILTAIEDKPVKTVADVGTLLRQMQDKEEITLTVKRSEAVLLIKVKLINSPMEIDFSNPGLLFNRQMVALKKTIQLSINPLEKAVALLNTGLCHMHFAEYDQAFEQLRQIQIARDTGIGPGTVQYRIAQCYRELGYVRESQETLRQAERYSQNTLLSDDGPLLSREIQRARSALE